MIDLYRYYLLSLGLSQKTLDYYIPIASSFLDHFTENIDNINPSLCSNYLISFDNLSNSSKNKIIASINKFLLFLSKNLNYKNCSFRLPYFKISRPLPKAVTDQDIKNILIIFNKRIKKDSSFLNYRNYAITIILYATGLRASELLNLNLSDIQGDWIRVNMSKGQKDRFVPFPEPARYALNNYLSSLGFIPTSKLFLNRYFRPLSKVGLCNIFKPFGLSPHVFRHTFATELLLGGADLSLVSDLLGHSSFCTTSIYTHIRPQHLQKTVLTCHPFSIMQ